MNYVELKKEINCLSFQNVCIGSLVELNANITPENWCNICEAIAVTGPLCNISLYRIFKKKKKLRSWKILDKHLSAGLPHKHTAFIPQWTLLLTWQFLICLGFEPHFCFLTTSQPCRLCRSGRWLGLHTDVKSITSTLSPPTLCHPAEQALVNSSQCVPKVTCDHLNPLSSTGFFLLIWRVISTYPFLKKFFLCLTFWVYVHFR